MLSYLSGTAVQEGQITCTFFGLHSSRSQVCPTNHGGFVTSFLMSIYLLRATSMGLGGQLQEFFPFSKASSFLTGSPSQTSYPMTVHGEERRFFPVVVKQKQP